MFMAVTSCKFSNDVRDSIIKRNARLLGRAGLAGQPYSLIPPLSLQSKKQTCGMDAV